MDKAVRWVINMSKSEILEMLPTVMTEVELNARKAKALDYLQRNMQLAAMDNRETEKDDMFISCDMRSNRAYVTMSVNVDDWTVDLLGTCDGAMACEDTEL